MLAKVIQKSEKNSKQFVGTRGNYLPCSRLYKYGGSHIFIEIQTKLQLLMTDVPSLDFTHMFQLPVIYTLIN